MPSNVEISKIFPSRLVAKTAYKGKGPSKESGIDTR